MDEALGSAKRRAWMVGIVLGVVAGVVAAGSGMMAGMCCLFQFGNAIVPAIAGLLGGGLAAALAGWAELPGAAAVGIGAGLGVRGGGLAAAAAGLVGFLLTLLWPVFSLLILSLGSKNADELVATLIVSLVGMAWSATLAAGFAAGGALIGVALGAGTGAIIGATMGRRE